MNTPETTRRRVLGMAAFGATGYGIIAVQDDQEPDGTIIYYPDCETTIVEGHWNEIYVNVGIVGPDGINNLFGSTTSDDDGVTEIHARELFGVDDSTEITINYVQLYNDRDQIAYSRSIHNDTDLDCELATTTGSPDDGSSNRFEIQAAPQARNLQYEFRTAGAVEAITQPDNIAAEPDGNDSINQNPDGTYRVAGITGQGESDTWSVAGNLTWFNTTGSTNEYTLLWNGQEIAPPDPESNRIEITTAPQSRNIRYEFIADGPIIPVTLPEETAAEPDGNDSITARDDGTFAVSGLTGAGASDTWLVDGELLEFNTLASEDEYTLLWNGEPRTDEDKDEDDNQEIEFLDCTTVRITGNFEEVMIGWSSYLPGFASHYTPVGSVSGTETINIADWSSDESASDRVVIDSVGAYTDGFDDSPDIHKENPRGEQCLDEARPDKPTVTVEDITRVNQSAYNVAFSYTNPNDIRLFAHGSFTTGRSPDTPPSELQPGQRTFSVTWRPESDDERLTWEFTPSGYGGRDAVSVATPPHGEVREEWTLTLPELRDKLDQFTPSEAEVTEPSGPAQSIELSNDTTDATITVHDDGTLTYEQEDAWWDVEAERDDLLRPQQTAISQVEPQSAARSKSAVQDVEQNGDTYTVTVTVESSGFGPQGAVMQLILRAVAPHLASYIIDFLPGSGSYSDFTISILQSIFTYWIRDLSAELQADTQSTGTETTTTSTESSPPTSLTDTGTTTTETPTTTTTETPTTTTETPTTTTTETPTTTEEDANEEEETTVGRRIIDWALRF